MMITRASKLSNMRRNTKRKPLFMVVGGLAILSILSLSVSAEDGPLRVRPADWARPVIGSELENFYQIDTRLYRSEQPDDDAFEQVEKLGMKEVLNLRSLHTDDDEAEETKLTLHHLRMKAGKVTENDLFQALRIIRDAKGPLLIHCWHGSDRTGAVVAAYRMVFQGWSAEKALDEMRYGGYGYHYNTYPNLMVLIKQLDADALRKKLDLADK